MKENVSGCFFLNTVYYRHLTGICGHCAGIVDNVQVS